MGKDLALEFESKRKEVLLTIFELEKTGIDVTLLKGSLEKIVQQYSKYEESEGLTFQDVLAHYAEGIVALNEFQDNLKTMYQDYLEIKKLLGEVENKEYSGALASKMLRIINELQYSTTLSYELEQSLVESVYETAYQLLKKEIAAGDSYLFSSIKENEITRSFINFKIHEEIEALDQKSDGAYSARIEKGRVDYLDEHLLLQLAHDTNPEYKRELKEKMDELQSDYTAYRGRVSDAYRFLAAETANLQERKKIKLHIFKRAFTLLAGAAIVLVVGKRAHTMILKTNPSYFTEQETYSTMTGEYESKSLGYRDLPSSQAELVVTEPWLEMNDGKYGQVQYHYQLDVDLEKIEDYLDLNLEELGIKPMLVVEEKTSLKAEDLIEKETIEITKWNVDVENVGLKPGDVAMFIFVTFALTIGLEAVEYAFSHSSLLLGSFIAIKKDLEELSRNSASRKKLLILLKKLNILLSENETFRARYQSLYHQYSNLLKESEKKSESIDFSELSERYSPQGLELSKKMLKKAGK